MPTPPRRRLALTALLGPLLALGLSLASAATASAAEPCVPSAASAPEVHGGIPNSCELVFHEYQCAERAKSDPHLAENLRDCAREKDTGAKLWDLGSGLVSCGATTLLETIKTPYTFYRAVAEDFSARDRAIDACLPSSECKLKILQDADPAAKPTPEELAALTREQLKERWLRAEARSIAENQRLSVVVASRGVGVARKLASQGLKVGSPDFERKLAEADPEYAAYRKSLQDGERQQGAAFQALVRNTAEKYYADLNCLSLPAATELACYSAQSLLGAAAAAKFLARTPRLAALLSKTRKGAETTRAVAALKAAPWSPEDADVLARARKVLGRDLKGPEEKAIVAAHHVGDGQPGRNGEAAAVGNYTPTQILGKARPLEETGSITTEERRKLMENAVVGRPAPEPGFRSGEQVAFQTSSGKPRQGSIQQILYDFDQDQQRARVVWQDPDTHDWLQKDLPLDKISRVGTGAPRAPPGALALSGDEKVDSFRRAFNAERFDPETSAISFQDPISGSRVAAHVIGRSGGKVEIEYVSGSIVQRRTLGDAELQSVRVSSVPQSPDYFQAYNRANFASQPTHTLPPVQSSNIRKFIDARGQAQRVQVTNDHQYREAALRRGDIQVHRGPTHLPPGDYTYVIRKDGTAVTGRVRDNFEVGVKHTHLADGEPVAVAGELSVGADGRIRYNIESGSYTRELIEHYGVPESELSRRAGDSLGRLLGSKPEPTHELFWNDRSPDIGSLRLYCADPTFHAFNTLLCRQHAPLDH